MSSPSSRNWFFRSAAERPPTNGIVVAGTLAVSAVGGFLAVLVQLTSVAPGGSEPSSSRCCSSSDRQQSPFLERSRSP
ncbi:hypothetical protein C490_05472 [Natronobacterium gregoryi SP2]|uniref:Uncharacterized protein n=1 Tax=Natronobacterium gregoryi (strain ATCC 43098 / DSM 3393 / CCM 3738 / CIP 104747 / IAM 13177 / JCM 8860 / NBRC 102187 / NCIMB 2189 / SP2) TaxID=797304 RepID=L9YBB6_NATGS|nr:hypothetical protein C490_05472 [Natronobacterium gregoryi SP2]